MSLHSEDLKLSFFSQESLMMCGKLSRQRKRVSESSREQGYWLHSMFVGYYCFPSPSEVSPSQVHYNKTYEILNMCTVANAKTQQLVMCSKQSTHIIAYQHDPQSLLVHLSTVTWPDMMCMYHKWHVYTDCFFGNTQHFHNKVVISMPLLQNTQFSRFKHRNGNAWELSSQIRYMLPHSRL